jgi:hypothetical protein
MIDDLPDDLDRLDVLSLLYADDVAIIVDGDAQLKKAI